MSEPLNYQGNSKSGSRFAEKSILALSCTVTFLLASWILLAHFAQPDDRLEILPKNISPEKADAFLKGLDDEKRTLFADQLRKEILSRPLNPDPIKKLAALAQTGSNISEGDDLVMLAANRVWRDVALQSSALKLELEKKDYAAAINRLNIVYFTQPDKQSDVLNVLAGLTAPQSFDALVDALSKKPKWRMAFLQSLLANPKTNVDMVYALFSALRKAAAPPTQGELQAFLQRLVATNAEDKAYFVWLNSLNAESLRKAGFIHDGGFDLPLSNQYFSWTYDKMPNVDGRITSRSPGSVDKVFRVDFSPARSYFRNFYQLLKLPPGAYVLTGEAKTENLVSQAGLVWRLICVGEASQTLASSKPISGSQQWTSFEMSFAIPDEGCSTQTIRLEVDAKTALDTQISGQAQFDNLSVTRGKQ